MKLINTLVFALVMFLIPLLALNQDAGNLQLLPVREPAQSAQTNNENQVPANSQPQEGNPAEPAAPHQTVELQDDGFQVLDERTGELFSVSARDYVRGALAAELPPTFHPEALKAQAVAAHTYALNLKRLNAEGLGEERLNGADLSADPLNWKSYTTEAVFRERYGELADAYWKTICDAADSVSAYLLTYEGEPIVAAYHSMSSGTTEDAANVWIGGKPYLVPVESFGDTLAPDFVTTETFSADEVAAALRGACPDIQLGADPSGWFSVLERSQGGYVTKLSAGDQQMHGKELRSLLDLRSSDFAISWDGAKFIFTVTGYGHGVGLSQYGADYMARQGATFDEILAHYYPGTTLAAIGQ